MKKFTKFTRALFVLGLIALLAAPAFGATPSTLKKNVWKAKQSFPKGFDAKGDVDFTGANVSGVNYETGDVFYVDSGSGQDTRGNDYGNSWKKPFATIEYAQNQCTASDGCVILVRAGHALTIDSAGELDLDIAGVRIIGVGEGRTLPTLTLSTVNTADIDIDAANITLENFVIDMTGGVDAIVAGIDVNAANFTLRNCEIVMSNSTVQATLALLADDNADRMKIENCRFIGSADAGPAAAIQVNSPSDVQIIDSYFEADFSSAAIYSTGGPDGLLLENLYITNYQDDDHAIELTEASGTATGVMRFVHIATNAFATAIDPGSLDIYESYWYDNDHPADNTGVPVLAAVDVSHNILGANSADNEASTSSVVYNRDGSVVERLEDIVDQAERTIVSTGKALPQTSQSAVFTIAGGPIEILAFTGEVVTEVQGQATNLTVRADPTTPATDTDLCVNLDLNADAVGTIYSLVTSTATALAEYTNGAGPGMGGVYTLIVPAGAIDIITDESSTGNITWRMRYRPLAPGVTVTAN